MNLFTFNLIWISSSVLLLLTFCSTTKVELCHCYMKSVHIWNQSPETVAANIWTQLRSQSHMLSKCLAFLNGTKGSIINPGASSLGSNTINPYRVVICLSPPHHLVLSPVIIKLSTFEDLHTWILTQRSEPGVTCLPRPSVTECQCSGLEHIAIDFLKKVTC